MAEDAEVMNLVYPIAVALRKYASSKGWGDSQSWIYYKTNPDLGRVYFTLVIDGLDDTDPYEPTRDVWAFLEKEFVGRPDVLKSLGLVVRSRKKVEEGGLYAIGSSYREFWTTDSALAH